MHPPAPHERSRRDFLKLAAAAGIGAPALLAFLDACGAAQSAPTPGGSATGLQIASPASPVKWPIFDDNRPIATGQSPEKDATLQIYTYADYLSPELVKAFQKKYNCKVAVSTFNDTDEAITKIRSGKVPYDVYFPSYDQISKLVTAKLVRPIQQSYVPSITNVWPTFQNPWYDQGWQYTIPYSVYSTGLGWRTDQVKEDPGARPNPYDILWDPKYKGKTAVIDDFHTAMSMVLLKNSVTDINTTNPTDIALMGTSMTELSAATSPKVTITMYNDLPLGQLGLCQMWSGDAINAVSYLPEGTKPTSLGYWFPADGKGMVDNDLTVILAGGKNPVLAHLFLDYQLQPENALLNFQQIGYQIPQVTFKPDTFVAQGLVPANLESAIVKEEFFDVGFRLLELPVQAQAEWQRVWQKFKAGG